MTTIELKQIKRFYKNNGQHAEQIARFTLTGEIARADNKPFWIGGDIGDIQIKSAKATICKGNDIESHLKADGANRYGYVTKDFSRMFLMTKVEYLEFSRKFSYETKDSNGKNGGNVKMKFKYESREMIEYLESRH